MGINILIYEFWKGKLYLSNLMCFLLNGNIIEFKIQLYFKILVQIIKNYLNKLFICLNFNNRLLFIIKLFIENIIDIMRNEKGEEIGFLCVKCFLLQMNI